MSSLARRGGRALLFVAGAGSLFLLVLWGVPTLVVVRSAAWSEARAAALGDAQVRSWIGAPLSAARLPGTWELGPEDGGGRFRFLVEGPGGRVEVEVLVSSGRRAQVRLAGLR